MAMLATASAAVSVSFSSRRKNSLTLRSNDPLSRPSSCWKLPSRKCNLFKETCQFVRKNVSEVFCSQLQLDDSINDEECELVNGIDLILGEGAETFHAYLLKAVKNNNETGVMLLSDIFGFRDSSTRDFAYRVACSGYNVLVPDLFRGNAWTKDQPREELGKWLNEQPLERVAKDIATSAQWMAGELEAAGISKELGIIGFCFGGARLIEALAGEAAVHFGTGVCFYGTRMDPALARGISTPILFIGGDDDVHCPVTILHEMEKKIPNSRVVIYHRRGHGFAHRPESPEEDVDAEHAFDIMKTWLHAGLIGVNK